MNQPPTVSYEPRRGVSATVDTALSNMATQDFVAIAFHTYMGLRALAAPESPDATMAQRFTLALWTVTVCTLFLVRGEIFPAGRVRALVYRLGLFLPMLLSYFELRFLLPSLQPTLVDAQLMAVDEALFGITPAVWMAQWNTLHVVEWIAFFYYTYFYLLAGVLLPSLFFDRGRRLIELLMGALVVCAAGHAIYTLVPGMGPHHHLQFAEPLAGGFWWSQVTATVDSAGAQLDIFPSLHTAYPVFFSLYTFGHRKDNVFFKWGWPVVAFFTAHMVLATMFLRWHWFIDVVAGLMLAVTARHVGIAVARREGHRGEDGDERQAVWERLFR